MIQGISVSVSHMQFHLLIKVHGGGAHMPSRRAIKTHPAQGTRTTFTPGMRGAYIYIYTCQDRYCSARVHPRAPRSGLLMECAHCTSLDCMAGRQHREDVVALVSSHWARSRATRCVPGSCLYCYLL